MDSRSSNNPRLAPAFGKSPSMSSTASRPVPQERQSMLQLKRSSIHLPWSQTCPSLVQSRCLRFNRRMAPESPDWTIHQDSVLEPTATCPEDHRGRPRDMQDKCPWPRPATAKPATRPKTPLREPVEEASQAKTPTEKLANCRLTGQSTSSLATSTDTACTCRCDGGSASTLSKVVTVCSSMASVQNRDGSPRIATSTPHLSV